MQSAVDITPMPDVKNDDFGTIADGVENAIMPRPYSINVMSPVHNAPEFDALSGGTVC